MFAKMIQASLQRVGFQLVRYPPGTGQVVPQIAFEDALELMFRYVHQDNFYFVQIGANDGAFRDPIYRFVKELDLRGCLVEPQPWEFGRLRDNYAGATGLTFVNAAVDWENGTRELYHYSDAAIERYEDFRGMASFDRPQLLRSLQQHAPRLDLQEPLDAYLCEMQVETVSWHGLRSRFDADSIDLLQIDTEGFDYEIIKMLDLENDKPGVINFEHRLLARSEWIECTQLLKRHGYVVFRHAGDTTAYLPL